MKNNKIKIGIAGLGTVGSGVINLLNNNKDEILKRTGCEFFIQCVSARNKDKARSCDLNNINFYTDPVDMLENEKIDIFVELIGGDDIAKNIVTRAIEKKIHIVTANKALIALHGTKINQLSLEKNCSVLYEASVAGAVPIIKVIKESLSANKIQWIAVIINGTTNYILTEMLLSGKNFNDVLDEAKDDINRS